MAFKDGKELIESSFLPRQEVDVIELENEDVNDNRQLAGLRSKDTLEDLSLIHI